MVSLALDINLSIKKERKKGGYDHDYLIITIA
jgi:hypothetical protein